MPRRQRLINGTLPRHVALIMDGNGRWARRRGKDRAYGHRKGAENIRAIATEANALGIEVLSVYAFSTENWKRPKDEIDLLMRLPTEFEEQFRGDFEESGIRVRFSGRRDRIGERNAEFMREVEQKTEDREGLILNICFDYGSRDELVRASSKLAEKVRSGELSLDAIEERHLEEGLYTAGLPPVDLLIRTSGEQRLSNFLLWQVAYAEFYFTRTPWPAFRPHRFRRALANFQKRNRKFGGLKKG